MRRLVPSLTPDRAREVVENLQGASTPNFDFFALVVVSTVICTLGLVTDSAAVIIGGMLVAPLMSPILAISAASLTGRRWMFGAAAGAMAQGVVVAILLSAMLGWFARRLPFELLTSLPQELLSRTRPSPIDLAVALAGGVAAAYALTQPNLSAALPGVAIATALLPPLSTVGVSLSLGSTEMASGALLLFLTNFFAITFAGIATFGVVGITPDGFSGNMRALLIPAVLVLAITIPLVLLTTSFVGQIRETQALERAVHDEVARLPAAQLVGVDSSDVGGTLSLEVTIRSADRPSFDAVVAFQDGLARTLQRRVAMVLTHVPITRLDPLDPPKRASSVEPRTSPSPIPSPTPSPVAPAPAPTVLPATD